MIHEINLKLWVTHILSYHIWVFCITNISVQQFTLKTSVENFTRLLLEQVRSLRGPYLLQMPANSTISEILHFNNNISSILITIIFIFIINNKYIYFLSFGTFSVGDNVCSLPFAFTTWVQQEVHLPLLESSADPWKPQSWPKASWTLISHLSTAECKLQAPTYTQAGYCTNCFGPNPAKLSYAWL